MPRPDWTTLAPPEPSRAPSCSVAVPTRRARAAERGGGDEKVATSFRPAKWQTPASDDRDGRDRDLDAVAPGHGGRTYQAGPSD